MTTESDGTIGPGEPPLPFPFTITCLWVLPETVNVHDGTEFELVAGCANTDERADRVRYTLRFHVANRPGVKVPAHRNLELLQSVGKRLGVRDRHLGARYFGLEREPFPQVVAEVSREVTGEVQWRGEDGLLSAPLSCGELLLEWHRTYKTHTSHPVHDLTWTRLWRLFPVLVRDGSEVRPRLHGWWDNPFGDAHVSDYVVTPAPSEVEYNKQVSAFARYQSGDPLLAGFERLVEVQTELLINGRPSEAVYQAATASETMITNLSLMMLWEQGGMSDDNIDMAASRHNKTLSERAANMQHLLGKPWGDLHGETWGDWYKDVWQVRNGVVHAARVVTVPEGFAAMSALVTLFQALAKSIGAAFGKYPKTCITLLGGGGMEAVSPTLRRRMDDYLKAQTEIDDGYPQQVWTENFLEWRGKVLVAAEGQQEAKRRRRKKDD